MIQLLIGVMSLFFLYTLIKGYLKSNRISCVNKKIRDVKVDQKVVELTKELNKETSKLNKQKEKL